MSDAVLVLTIATALGAGIIGGAFYAFSAFIMAGLERIPSAEGIRAMQEINVTVLTPWFMVPLFGTGVACLALIVVSAADWDGSYSPFLVAAGALYLVGCLGVTMALNVPRNNVLAKLEPARPESGEVWRRYLTEWTRWNSVRTGASLAALALLIVAAAA